MSIKIKSEEQLEIMKEGGRITGRALREVISAAKPGVSLISLEKLAGEYIREAGAEPAFKRVAGYGFTTCLNINDGVVHGIPSERRLREGDLLSVDLGAFYKGLNTDAAWTVYVGSGSQAPQFEHRFLETGREALREAIGCCHPGNHIRDISLAMERVIRREGYSPVEMLVGHGVGADLHEDPQIPCLATADEGPELAVGMTLAIEVIYTAGKPDLKTLPDRWTIVTADGSLSALFEHTVAVTASGPIVLTS